MNFAHKKTIIKKRIKDSPIIFTGIAAVSVMFLLVIVFRLAVGPLVYTNDSPSAPRGIYIAAPNQQIHYGDYVIVHCPQDMPELNVKKGFPMLKKAAGFTGDSYEVTGDALITRGRTYPIQHLSYLPQLKPVKAGVPINAMLFLNDPPDSLDSRYLGPISIKNIDKKVFLLISYDKINEILGR